ncbi:MAG: hypothetical protein F6K04_18635 [Leptolyngbya sp. SIO4C5]|nr:hypothetical protein [Leptolyngbya sp. SIO4C5]
MNTSRITQRTGIDVDTSHLLDFIKAPIKDVIRVLDDLAPIEIQRNVYSRRIRVDDSGYLFYQIRGNSWTTIEYVASSRLQINSYIPEIVKTLRAKTVHYEYNDTTEFMSYTCSDSTGVLDSYSYSSDDLSEEEFEEEDLVDPFEQVSQRLANRGIYALCGEWSGRFTSAGSWLNISDPGVFSEDFTAFDYLILRGSVSD